MSDSGPRRDSGPQRDPEAWQPRDTGQDPEAVLSQALRAMAGGERAGAAHGEGRGGAGPGLTTTQILLIAAIVGLVIGMAVGLTVLLVR